MATSDITVRISVKDLATVKLFYLELVMLRDRMRVAASPFAEDIERIIERFDERDEAADRPAEDVP